MFGVNIVFLYNLFERFRRLMSDKLFAVNSVNLFDLTGVWCKSSLV